MADDYFATLAYDHRVKCGFYDHAPIRESYERNEPSDANKPDESDELSVPDFGEFDDDDIII